MNAEQALADLTEISSQIEAAAVFDGEGKVIGSTLDDEQRARQLATAARELWRSAADVQPGSTPTQFEIATTEGSLFVVRDGETYIAATTAANPTVGLVFYDLKSTLRNLQKEEPQPEPEAQPAPASEDKAAKPRKTTTAGTKKKTAARKTTTRKRKTDAP